jgi:hypothetical protein
MSAKEDPTPSEPHASLRTPSSSYPLYATILLTALVVLLFALLVAHGVMVSKIADAPKQFDQSVQSIHSGLTGIRSDLTGIRSDLTGIRSEILSVASSIRAGFSNIPSTVTVSPVATATFTMASARF